MLERGRLTKRYPPAVREKVQAWCSIIDPIMDAPGEETRERLIEVAGIDDGEELLFGLVHENPGCKLLSADKTAMRALRNAPQLQDVHASLCGRVACLESVLLALLEMAGTHTVIHAVGLVRPYNIMLNSVFSRGTETPLAECQAGLSSYIQHLRSEVGASFLVDFARP